MTLRAGYAQRDITPGGRCELNGFLARRQPALGVGAPVHARVLMLESGRTRAVVAVCDLLGFTLADSARLEATVGEAAGVPAAHVLLCCTHTHSAPMSMPLGTVGRHRPGYVRLVERRLARAARAAAADLAPIRAARFGDAPAAAFGAFRCATDLPGRDRFPGRLSALRLDRDGAPPITVGHLGVHPYVLGPAYRYVHPDYPGAVCDALAGRTRGYAMMLPGAGADVSPVDGFSVSVRHLARWASRAAEAIDEVLRDGDDWAVEPLKAATLRQRVRFGFMVPFEVLPILGRGVGVAPWATLNRYRWQAALERGELPRGVAAPVHAIRLGELLLLGLPCEVFHDTGADMAAALPEARVLTVAHAGGNFGYLPRPFAYERLLYEARAYEWYGTAGSAEPAAEPALRAAALKAARRVMDKPRQRGG